MGRWGAVQCWVCELSELSELQVAYLHLEDFRRFHHQCQLQSKVGKIGCKQDTCRTIADVAGSRQPCKGNHADIELGVGVMQSVSHLRVCVTARVISCGSVRHVQC